MSMTPVDPATFGGVPPYLDQLYRAQSPERFEVLPEKVHLSWVMYAHWSWRTARSERQMWEAVSVAHDLALAGFLGAHFEVAQALRIVGALGHARMHLEASVSERHPQAQYELDRLEQVSWQGEVRCPVQLIPV